MIWLLLILWILGFILVKRIPQCPAAIQAVQPSTLSIIIPARNEADNLQRLLASIAHLKTPPLEVIVVDDASTDDTAKVARSHQATLLTAPPLPEGWRGKTWACQQGAEAACGQTLLFLDADLRLLPEALDRIAAARERYRSQVISLGPFHEVQKPYEELSALFNLTTFIGMGSFSFLGHVTKPQGLFGPFFLIDRSLYQDVGGHTRVKGEILEHMSLVAPLREKEARMLCLGGKEVVHTRMYPDGIQSLVEGWSKAFATGAARTHPVYLFLTVAWISGGVSAALLAVDSLFSMGSSWELVLVYLAYALQFWILLRQMGSFSMGSSLLYPVLLMAFFFIFGRSLFLKLSGRAVTWKGRSIEAVPPNKD